MVVDAYNIPLEKTTIIINVFPPVSSSRLPVTSNRVILWAGRMLYLKNLQRLIRAFANINVSSYELHLVGEGPERKNLERLTNEYHAGSRIKFFDSMDHGKLMDKLASSTAVVLPSLSDVGPNIVAEAVGAGVPVIMTKESGYAEIFHHKVELINPLDEGDLRRKLEKLMREPAERVVSAFTIRPWVTAAKDWISLFKSL